ncbi:radical SAM protein [Gammaproteobacteria bacterium]|nr:radical SAM protein [Gammaproteobacteria bacterium]
MSDRTNMSEIESVKFTDVETILESKFGERFRKYREEYRKSLNYDTNGYVGEFPLTVSFELVNRCNLKCVMCWTDNHKGSLAKLDEEMIDKLLKEIEENNVPAVILGLGSETLVSKGAKEVLRKVKEAGVMDIFFGSNGVLLDKEVAQLLIDLEIARVEVSLDAATPETFHKIRGKDQLPRIEKNMEKLLEVKKESNAALPVVRLCFCEQAFNKHEKEQFVEKWSGRADYVDFQDVQDFSYVNELLETGDVEAFKDLEADDLPYIECAYPFNSLNVWSNGDISPCCTYYGKNLVFGNIRENSLEEVWHGEEMNALRKEMITKKLKPTCKACFASRDPKYFTGALATAGGISAETKGTTPSRETCSDNDP